jgi:fumarate reductase flavoprotein subunit
MQHITAVKHIHADIGVLGTGGAGMAATVTAAKASAKVVILEKRPFPGGASNTPVGFVFVKNDRESQDKAFKAHIEGTLWTANADLVREYIDTSGDISAWLSDKGVQPKISDQRTQMGETAPGNGRFQAAAATHGYCGFKAIARGHDRAQLIKTMVSKARELGTNILFSTPGKMLLRGGNRITRVYAATKDGNLIQVDTGAVIIATAGFNEDP